MVAAGGDSTTPTAKLLNEGSESLRACTKDLPTIRRMTLPAFHQLSMNLPRVLNAKHPTGPVRPLTWWRGLPS